MTGEKKMFSSYEKNQDLVKKLVKKPEMWETK
jgi:hypothetical protein